MPSILIPSANDTCFYCGNQAFFISVNTKVKRCTERTNNCPAVIEKMKQGRKNSGFDINSHMKKMSKNGNTKLKELHQDSDWLQHKSEKIKESIATSGGHAGKNNPMFNKVHSENARHKQSLKANARCPSVYVQATNTKIANGISIPKELKSDWQLYEEQVNNITRSTWNKFKRIINPNNLPRGQGYQLDHKLSKKDGFLNNIPPEIIGHYKNLKILTEFENKSKGSNSSILISDLYEQVNSK